MQKSITLLLAVLIAGSGLIGYSSAGSINAEKEKIVSTSEALLVSYDKHQLVNDATAIVKGTIVSKEVKEDFEGFPATDFTLKIETVFKGAPDQEVIIRTRGGETATKIYTPELEHIATFRVGEQALVFLTDGKGDRPDRDQFGYFVVGQFQGKFTEKGGKWVNEKYNFDVKQFEQEIKEIDAANKQKGLKKLTDGANPNDI